MDKPPPLDEPREIAQPEEEFAYIKERVNSQLEYFSKAASRNKLYFYIVEIIVLLASAAIPVCNSLALPEGSFRIISSLLSGAILVFAGLGRLYKYHELWLNARMTAELLKREKHLFLYKAGPYAGLKENERKRLLVEQVENIVATEVTQFISLYKEREARLPAPAPLETVSPAASGEKGQGESQVKPSG